MSEGENTTQPSGNPYATPSPASEYSSPDGILAQEASKVNQVMVVGILQIVLGVMELGMGAVLLFSAFFMTYVFSEMSNQPGAEPPPQMFIYGMQAYYIAGGILVSVFSLMRIGSGIGSFWFRGRTWMIISLIGGMASVLTCYCSIFSVGLGIYGLVVMFSSGVKKAYRLAAEGMPAAEIKQRFMAAGYGRS